MAMRFANAGNHHRGWTLVERGRLCFANKNNTNVYRLVCRANTEEQRMLARFRAVVDGEEGE